MATATATTPTLFTPALSTDIMRRGVKRVLPCKLTDAEFMQIAKQRVDKEALRDQIVDDFDTIKSKHKAQLDELDGEIGKARKELHTGEQDRTVLCNDVFWHDDKGAGWVCTIRTDTGKEVERRPATPTEAQRYLPGIEGAPVDKNAPLLDQAAAAQGRPAAAGESDGVPDGAEPRDEDDGLVDAEGGDADPDGDGKDETSAQKAARESEEGRAARRAGKGKRGGKAGK